MKNINPTVTTAWHVLKKHFEKIKDIKMSTLFKEDKDRFNKFSIMFKNEILVDFSKNRITKETMEKLINLARESGVKHAIKSMFQGEKINKTENQSVLHIALRNRSNRPIFLDGENIMPKINKVLSQMKNFSELVIHGIWKGYTGCPITDIVNIGIGGSDLGPCMITEALKFYKNHLNIHFVSNIDGTHIIETLKKINPEKTLFLVASKTFTTKETMTNAYTARSWFLNFAKDDKYIEKHFIALSTNRKEVINFGININNMFEFWNWVGGRYSLWSSIGLSIVLSIGYKNFELLLSGAHAMDEHFSNMPEKKNIPVILALISIWYSNFFGSETEAVLPYDQYMHRFTAYLQQSNMESNGKSVDRNGFSIDYQTSPIIWGEPGTNGQHSFYQLIHQGTKLVPCDFIAPVLSHHKLNNHHVQLLSNFFAQTKALAFGKSKKIVEQELLNDGKNLHLFKNIIPFKVFKGNIPTNSILLRKINPFNLGALIALYEHKIFTQGTILNIFTFDQWGVELGKTLATCIYKDLKHKKITENHDSSTNGLINCYKSWR